MKATLCVECGPNVNIDEDGCCLMCGNGAVGNWLEDVADPNVNADSVLAANVEALNKEIAKLRRLLDDATTIGLRLADLECDSNAEDALEAIRADAGI